MDASGSPNVTRDADVAVIGAGPAGLALAAALVERGLTVALIDPRLDARGPAWAPRYCMWRDEAEALDLLEVCATTWSTSAVRAEGRTLRLPRGYACVDNSRLVARTLARAGDALRLVRARAPDALPAGGSLLLEDGSTLRCRSLIDARGAPATRETATQVAWGAVVDDAPADLLAGDAALVMSLDAAPELPGAPSLDPRPTFLYALPLGGGQAFLEETSLAARPALPVGEARRRLLARLAFASSSSASSAHLASERTHGLHDTEVCAIRLDADDPARSSSRPAPSRIDAPAWFGARAGLVHPCTGYSFATAWALAPRVADAVAAELASSTGEPGARVAAAVHSVLWPVRRRRARALQRIGLDLLLSLDARALSAFFHSVFSAPAATWRAFVDGDPDPDVLMGAMSSLFGGMDGRMRFSLSRIVVRRHPSHVPALLRAAFAGAAR